jgi:hypothetical protein
MSVETTDYPIVTPETLATQVVLNARRGRAVWFHGPAGAGKSECVVELGYNEMVKRVAWSRFCKANGLDIPAKLDDLEVIHLTIPQMEAEDFVGVPFHKRVDGKEMDQERTTSWAPAEFLRRNKPVILFLDEANAAETRVQKVLLQIVQERKVFNVSLPEGTIIILAGNRSTDRAAVKMVPFPLGNRCAHYTFLNSAKSWGNWALRNDVPAIFVAWVNQNPSENLHGYSQADTSLAQLTPRSLFYAAMDYVEGRGMGLDFSEIESAIAANIGYSASIRLNAWLRLKDELPTVDEIKASPEAARLPERGRVDRSYFLASMLMDALRQPGTTAPEMAAICTYMDRVATELPEVTDALAWVGQSLAQMSKEGTLPMAKMAAVVKAVVGRKTLADTLMQFFQAVNQITPVAKAS